MTWSGKARGVYMFGEEKFIYNYKGIMGRHGTLTNCGFKSIYQFLFCGVFSSSRS